MVTAQDPLRGGWQRHSTAHRPARVLGPWRPVCGRVGRRSWRCSGQESPAWLWKPPSGPRCHSDPAEPESGARHKPARRARQHPIHPANPHPLMSTIWATSAMLHSARRIAMTRSLSESTRPSATPPPMAIAVTREVGHGPWRTAHDGAGDDEPSPAPSTPAAARVLMTARSQGASPEGERQRNGQKDPQNNHRRTPRHMPGTRRR